MQNNAILYNNVTFLSILAAIFVITWKKKKFCIRVQNIFLNECPPSFPSPFSLLSLIDPIEATNKPENYYLQAACEVDSRMWRYARKEMIHIYEWKRWTDSQIAPINELHHGFLFCCF